MFEKMEKTEGGFNTQMFGESVKHRVNNLTASYQFLPAEFIVEKHLQVCMRVRKVRT